ncbi:MAG: SRPBCC family protein [Nocardioides sp.]|nr:SRPBCC family protein [Nocardioides sp.]
MTSGTDVEPLIEETIEIAAEPAQVWALVTDLPRMAAWSPQVVKTIIRGGNIGLGTRTLNVNRRGPLFWPTRSKVVRFEPHSEFAFRIAENKSIWSFSLEPTVAGTRVTQRRTTPDGLSSVSGVLTKKVLGGQVAFQTELRDGMRQTLERIKTEVES